MFSFIELNENRYEIVVFVLFTYYFLTYKWIDMNLQGFSIFVLAWNRLPVREN